MIRKFFALFLTVLFAVVLTAADYQILAIGDIHYDAAEYHPANTGNKWQLQERSRNAAMWQKSSRDLLAASAKVLNDSFPFVVQLGDFSQGDSDTPELQKKMLLDAFRDVKQFYPAHKLLAVKGNHDYRLTKGTDHAPFNNDFLQLIAKELGKDSISSNYTVLYNNDLYIFFDCSLDAKTSINFVDKALKDHPDTRYVFFLTHYPVFPCYHNTPGGIIPGRAQIRKLLASRNAIILAAHTHIPSFISVTLPEGNLTQLVLSSMGHQWNLADKPAVQDKNYDEFCAKIPASALNREHPKTVVAEMRNFQINEYTRYTSNSGFAIIKINDNNVTAEIYTDPSGTPWLTKTLRQK